MLKKFALGALVLVLASAFAAAAVARSTARVADDYVEPDKARGIIIWEQPTQVADDYVDPDKARGIIIW